MWKRLFKEAQWQLGISSTEYDVPDENGTYAIHNAAKMGPVARVIDILEKFPGHVNLPQGEREKMPLHFAVSQNSEMNHQIVRILLERGADMFAQWKENGEYNGQTPLFTAASMGDGVSVNMIIEALKAGVGKKYKASQIMDLLHTKSKYFGHEGADVISIAEKNGHSDIADKLKTFEGFLTGFEQSQSQVLPEASEVSVGLEQDTEKKQEETKFPDENNNNQYSGEETLYVGPGLTGETQSEQVD